MAILISFQKIELYALLISKKKDFSIEITFGFKNTISYKAKNC